MKLEELQPNAVVRGVLPEAMVTATSLEWFGSEAQDAMDATDVQRIREDMERAEACRLQPHSIESFFLAAFEHLGGTVRKREPDFGVTGVSYDLAELLERSEAA